MKRNELEQKILEQHPELLKTNLQKLLKPHLESWVNNDEVTLSSEVLIKIFLERNERARINQRLNNENFGLKAKLGFLTNWSKSEILQSFKNLFGMMTKEDDAVLSEIGAVSKESAREDLGKSEKIVDDAIDIVKKYRKKYGGLD